MSLGEALWKKGVQPLLSQAPKPAQDRTAEREALLADMRQRREQENSREQTKDREQAVDPADRKAQLLQEMREKREKERAREREQGRER